MLYLIIIDKFVIFKNYFSEVATIILYSQLSVFSYCSKLCRIYTSSLNSKNICDLLVNTLDYKKPHKKKSGGVKSGERGHQEILSLCEITR
jgi:hypothetical protein